MDKLRLPTTRYEHHMSIMFLGKSINSVRSAAPAGGLMFCLLLLFETSPQC